MYKLYKYDNLSVKDMTPMEVTLIYYLLKYNAFDRYESYSSMPLVYQYIFREEYNENSMRNIRQAYADAVNHLEELDLITVTRVKNKIKEIEFSQLVSDKYILLDDEAYKIFNIQGESKTSVMKIFKLYVYMIDSLYRSPTLSGKTYKDYYLGFLPAKQICDDMGITYNTYAKYVKYLEDLKLLYVKRDNTYRCSLDTGSNTSNSYRVPYVYCHYKDKDKADEYVTKRNELNSYHTSTTTTAESKLHKRYAALYNQICNGNTDYELNELEEIYKYLQSENEKNALEKKKHSNTLYAENLRIRDLSILEDLINAKQDYDMPF